jgi:hypothetical protein
MNSILGDVWNTCDPINRIRKTAISVAERNPDTILILKVAKVLRAVESEKVYLKPIDAKPKDVEKMKKETKELEPHEYMEPFAWTYLAPFDDDGCLLSKDFSLSELRPLKVRWWGRR